MGGYKIRFGVGGSVKRKMKFVLLCIKHGLDKKNSQSKEAGYILQIYTLEKYTCIDLRDLCWLLLICVCNVESNELD